MGDFFTDDAISETARGDPEGCSKDLRKVLYLIAAAAVMILVVAYWYSEYYSKGVGMRPAVAEGASPLRDGATPSLVNWPPPPFTDTTTVAPLAPSPMTSRQESAIPVQVTTARPVKGGFAAIVKRLRNSVVNVNATAGSRAPEAIGPQDGRIRFANPSNPMQAHSPESIGSGIVVRNDGYILTNYHVVRGADLVTVTVFDDFGAERYPAGVVKLERATDLALLRIKPKSPLVPAVLGDSDRIQIADEVIAIGSPFGLGQTVSRGIVSAVRKALVIEGVTHSGLIQTDAAINQGNSGGPLVHENGTVIGVNTAIYTPTGAFSGVGFAVPSNQARSFLLDEIELPNVKPVAALARSVAQQGQGSAAVGNAGPAIVAGTPAPHADGREQLACSNCHQVIDRPTNGATSTAVAFSDYRFAQAPSSLAMNVMAPGRASPSGTARDALGSSPVLVGAGLRAIDASVGNRLNHPPGKGLLVDTVVPGSPADRSGLNPGDIILKLDGRRVGSPRELIDRIRRFESGTTVRLSVRRDNRNREAVLTLANGVVGSIATVPENAARRTPTEFNWFGVEIETFTSVYPAVRPGQDELRGAVIAEVSPNTPAYQAGLRANDIILEINNLPVGSAALMDRAIRRSSQRQENLLRVFRNGRDFFVFL